MDTDGEMVLRFIRALKHHTLTCEPITAQTAHAAEMLPWHHKDPGDKYEPPPETPES